MSHPEKKEYLPRVYSVHSLLPTCAKEMSRPPLSRAALRCVARDGITTPHRDAILVLAGKQAASGRPRAAGCRAPLPGTSLSCYSLVEEARDLGLFIHRSRPSVSSGDRNHPVVDHRHRDSSSKPQLPLRLPWESANRRMLGRQGGSAAAKMEGCSSTTGFCWRSTHARQRHDGNSPGREKDVAVSHFASGEVIIFRVPLGIMGAVPSRG